MPENNKAETHLPISTPLNEVGFRIVFDLYWKRLLSFCEHHINDEDTAMDLVQDIFCSLWNRRQTLTINTSMEHYLFRAARIKISDHFRIKYKRMQQAQCLSDGFCEAVNTTEETIHHHDLDHFIDGLVNRLPCRCRQVYTLSRHHGFSIREIADQLELSEKTVEAHLTKALGFLRKRLQAQKP